MRFAKACAVSGVRPLFGSDLAVPLLDTAVTGRTGQPGSAAGERRRTPARGGAFVDESAPRITLLARDKAGWANLCALITAGWAARAERGGQPVVPWEAIQEHAEGLTVLLGPGSQPVRALAASRSDTATKLLAPWREAFGPHLRLEAVHHRRSGTAPGSLRLAARTVGPAGAAGDAAECSVPPDRSGAEVAGADLPGRAPQSFSRHDSFVHADPQARDRLDRTQDLRDVVEGVGEA